MRHCFSKGAQQRLTRAFCICQERQMYMLGLNICSKSTMSIHNIQRNVQIKTNFREPKVSHSKHLSTEMNVTMSHTHTQFIYSPLLSPNTQRGGWEGGQSLMLSQLLSGVPQLSTPSTPHTVSRRKGHRNSLGPHSCSKTHARAHTHVHTLAVSRVSCFSVTPWTIHFGDFNLHGGWDLGGTGLGRRWWPDIMKSQFETSIKSPECRRENILQGMSRVITHTLG